MPTKYEEEIKKQNERIKWVMGGIDIEDLTNWEQEFLESIEAQSDKGKFLSDRQMEILEKIYKEKGK